MGEWREITLEGSPFLLKEESGVFFLHSMGEADYRSEEKVARLSKVLGLSHLFRLRQVHGANILTTKCYRRGLEGDGLVLSDQDRTTGIAVLTADCAPVLIIAPRHLVLLHVGWKGMARGIVHKGLKILKAFYGESRDFKIWFGPHIKQCCYNVGRDVLNKLSLSLSPKIVDLATMERGGEIYLSLESCIQGILREEGVSHENFETCQFCTKCSGAFPSYRRDGERSPRMINLAWRQW